MLVFTLLNFIKNKEIRLKQILTIKPISIMQELKVDKIKERTWHKSIWLEFFMEYPMQRVEWMPT